MHRVGVATCWARCTQVGRYLTLEDLTRDAGGCLGTARVVGGFLGLAHFLALVP